jgi:hypothetical protein
MATTMRRSFPSSLGKVVDRIKYQRQRLVIERHYRHWDGAIYKIAKTLAMMNRQLRK